MRVRLIAVLILSFLVGCGAPEPRHVPEAAQAPAVQQMPKPAQAPTLETLPESPSARQAVLPFGYSLTDTTHWGNTIGWEGKRAVLRRGREIIDTVDLDFGVLLAGKDSLVFLPIRTDSAGFDIGDGVMAYESSPTVHVLWTPLRRRKLSDVLPFFSADFSSPTIGDTLAIHYWGFPPKNTTCRLYAMRYDFRTAHLDSLFLMHYRQFATDAQDYFGTPHIRGTEVSFGAVMVDRKTWRVVHKDSPADPRGDSVVAEVKEPGGCEW